MELRVLKYFLSVAKHHNISRAAEELHITQPTLSRQLQDLEKELGTPLFIREKKRMELTEAGLFLKARAEEMTTLEAKTLNQFAHPENIIAGDVYIGCGETQAMNLISNVLSPLLHKYPQLRLHLVSGNYKQTIDALDKGVLDFGLLCLQAPPTDFIYLRIPFDNRWGIYLHQDDPLSKQASIRPQDLEHQPLIISHQLLSDHIFDHWLGNETNNLHIRATYNLVYNAAFLAEMRSALLLSFEGLIPTECAAHPNLTFRPLEPPLYSQNYFIWKKGQTFSSASTAIRLSLEEHFGEHQ